MIEQNIKDIIQSQDPHVGMDQLFFTDKAVFDLSYDAVFKKQWVFLTHMSYFNDNAIFTYQINGGYIEIKKLKDNSLTISSSIADCHSHLKVYESLVFVNFSEIPHSFDEFIKPLEPYIKMHGLNDGKIAFQKDFLMEVDYLTSLGIFILVTLMKFH